MKGLTLWQPGATAIALGHKTFETRGARLLRSVEGQRIAIHAALTNPSRRDLEADIRFLVRDGHLEWLQEQRVVIGLHIVSERLPRGVIVATAVVGSGSQTHRMSVSAKEAAVGDFRVDRWAWPMIDVRPLQAPIECKGAQGLWTVPNSVVSRLP